MKFDKNILFGNKDEYIVDNEFDFFFQIHKIIKNRIIDNIEELGLLTQP